MATAISSSNSDIVLLTDVVRDQYVRYLERQLEENVCVWAAASRNHHKPTAWACIGHSIKALEARAIKACQAAQLYQRAMVKMIAAVRRNTQECRLAEALFEHMQRQQVDKDVEHKDEDVEDAITTKKTVKHPEKWVDKSTQTTAIVEEEAMPNGEHNVNNYTSYTLCQKIDLFQSRLAEHETNHQQQPQLPVKLSMASPTSSIEEDTVSQELAKLFDDEPTDLKALFGIDIDIEMEPSAVLVEPTEKPMSSPDITLPLPQEKHINNQQVDLRHSRWPCELYAQRRRLNACLVRLLDADWRCEDALRYKFHMLFGEDSDDEFATEITSPSIDLVDEVLLASCILRIRPWIVHHLMRPLQEGLIANRFLFKKLAKMLANNIVLINPYSSERQVKQAVEQLFCILPRGVQSEVDLEFLPSVFIERFES